MKKLKKGQRQKTAPVFNSNCWWVNILIYEIWKAHHLMSLEGESFQRSPVWHLWLPLRKGSESKNRNGSLFINNNQQINRKIISRMMTKKLRFDLPVKARYCLFCADCWMIEFYWLFMIRTSFLKNINSRTTEKCSWIYVVS